MFTLLVSNQIYDRNVGDLTLDVTRFLEYTDESIRLQMQALSTDAIACILSWPCVAMEEGRGQEPVFLRQIASIRHSGRSIVFGLMKPSEILTLSSDDLWRLRHELDIGEFEFSRNHIAIKDRDLFDVLGIAGHIVPQSVRGSFSELPLPAPTRAKLLEARDAIGRFGHTQIDDLLLEIGVDAITADRTLGSRHDRANAIIKYAIDNPGATTAETALLGPFLVRAAYIDSAESADDATNERAARNAQGPRESTAQIVARPRLREPNRVFVVHGRDDEARRKVVAFLESVGLIAIVLHDQPSMGRHLLTKLIDEAELVTFAVILMTADDVGGLTGSTDVRPRARQNVVLELGYFLSHLGQSRVCALVSPGVETPSDFDGIVYIGMSADDVWKTTLLRELRAAELPVSR